jgi:hypothetical protein
MAADKLQRVTAYDTVTTASHSCRRLIDSLVIRQFAAALTKVYRLHKGTFVRTQAVSRAAAVVL